jgi:hypothetical protein
MLTTVAKTGKRGRFPRASWLARKARSYSERAPKMGARCCLFRNATTIHSTITKNASGRRAGAMKMWKKRMLKMIPARNTSSRGT